MAQRLKEQRVYCSRQCRADHAAKIALKNFKQSQMAKYIQRRRNGILIKGKKKEPMWGIPKKKKPIVLREL